jgi:hypothetical protein
MRYGAVFLSCDCVRYRVAVQSQIQPMENWGERRQNFTGCTDNSWACFGFLHSRPPHYRGANFLGNQPTRKMGVQRTPIFIKQRLTLLRIYTQKSDVSQLACRWCHVTDEAAQEFQARFLNHSRSYLLYSCSVRLSACLAWYSWAAMFCSWISSTLCSSCCRSHCVVVSCLSACIAWYSWTAMLCS